ncbi:response regulator transcription factor [Spirosoma sp. BT702]|uniref:Response regulator transcription factor n=1 Tax=Spirosoma profusum TaxID=2771354 RepID=A0A927GAS1_9BACT|nr:LytTR family DNA-binding domain-containing protein [Spirosoma profusum]MBD2705340.1 response regulator transcription factor [Spirosoma profusum]
MHALILVETDEWGTELESILESLGYEHTKSTNALDIVAILKAQPIDLIICETIVNEKDTITLFQNIPELQCSIIFITDSPSEETYDRTTYFERVRFLVKPFHQLTLRSMVDSLTSTTTAPIAIRGIKVRSSTGQRLLVPLDKILWISTDKNYSILHARRNRYVLKQSLTKLSKQLDSRFVQVHKGFWVNIYRITQVHLSRRQISINESIIPIGKTYRSQFEERLIDLKKSVIF